MIISHSRKFIFIKTKKTAGTSLEIALSKYCAKGDILGPLVDYDEKTRRRFSGLSAQNNRKTFREASNPERLRMIATLKSVPRFHEHVPAVDVRAAVGRRIWDSYFKFTIVRNPFDRIISRYFWSYNNNTKAPERWNVTGFNQYLRYFPELINENWKIYTEADEMLVDDVARYEHFEEDLARISEAIGLGHNLDDDLKGITAKSGVRPKSVDIGTLIGPEEEALIRTLCRKEIEAFGYSFADVAARSDQAAAKA